MYGFLPVEFVYKLQFPAHKQDDILSHFFLECLECVVVVACLNKDWGNPCTVRSVSELIMVELVSLVLLMYIVSSVDHFLKSMATIKLFNIANSVSCHFGSSCRFLWKIAVLNVSAICTK